MDETPILDHDVLERTRNAIGPDRLRGVLQVMADTSREEALVTARHIAERDFAEARRLAHGLAGAALYLGAGVLGQAARAIELADEPTVAQSIALRAAIDLTVAEISRTYL